MRGGANSAAQLSRRQDDARHDQGYISLAFAIRSRRSWPHRRRPPLSRAESCIAVVQIVGGRRRNRPARAQPESAGLCGRPDHHRADRRGAGPLPRRHQAGRRAELDDGHRRLCLQTTTTAPGRSRSTRCAARSASSPATARRTPTRSPRRRRRSASAARDPSKKGSGVGSMYCLGPDRLVRYNPGQAKCGLIAPDKYAGKPLTGRKIHG